ncbi:MAG: hypothetical protein ACRELC_13930, partial [Gemmatimonadota bacterium]
LDTPAGLEARRLGAFGDFALAYTGAPIGGGGTEGQVMMTGLFADEWQSSGTFPTRVEVDARKIQIDNSSLATYFGVQHLARRAAESTLEAFLASDALEDSEKDVPVAELSNLAGYTYVFFGEGFCSGVPFSRVTEQGELEFGSPLTTTEIFEEAILRFDQALARAQAAVDLDLEFLARVGKARALLDLGQFAAAASEVASVPTDWEYLIRYSSNSDRQKNGIQQLNQEFERWTVANAEGGNGLAYRDAFTAGDPRTPWVRTPEDDVGFDTSIPQYDELKFPEEDTDVPLASGVEARLIEAEAALQAADVAGFEATHNALRATIGLPPIDADPLSAAERVSLHFEERALWLWLTGHRHGDLRRLIRQYGATEDEVFPIGAYFKVQAGDYGDDVNLPVPFDEENNPNFEQCLDRGA